MPFETKLFKKNQLVWIQYLSGDMAAKVTGKYKGFGRYISAWVKWDGAQKPVPNIKTLSIDCGFANRMGIEIV